MQQTEIKDALMAMLQDVAPLNETSSGSEDQPLDSLGYDSLDLASFLLMIEEKMAVKISDDEVERLATLNDYVDLLSKRLS